LTIAGIVLAAGSSERMGGVSKQLLEFGDRSMVGFVVANAEATSLDPIVVVTGHDAEAVEQAAGASRAAFVRNPRHAEGNMTSYLAGVDAVGPCDAVMLLVADQPEVSRDVVETLAAAWERDRPFAAVATYGGVPGHPWVLSAEAIAASRTLRGTKALWRWLSADHAADVLEVEMGTARPGDVNTMADYRAVARRLGLAPEA
jgi:molybdenum cofactor cytidylyltransferase